jgi:hypothetical protein
MVFISSSAYMLTYSIFPAFSLASLYLSIHLYLSASAANALSIIICSYYSLYNSSFKTNYSYFISFSTAETVVFLTSSTFLAFLMISYS